MRDRRGVAVAGSPAVRLRQLAETSTGARVIVPRQDLLDALQPGAAQAPAREGPQEAEIRPEMAGRPEGGVILRLDRESAYRLAKAAWNTSRERVEAHGRWTDLPYATREQQADLAARTLELLAGVGEEVAPEPPSAVPAVVPHVDPGDEEPPF